MTNGRVQTQNITLVVVRGGARRQALPQVNQDQGQAQSREDQEGLRGRLGPHGHARPSYALAGRGWPDVLHDPAGPDGAGAIHQGRPGRNGDFEVSKKSNFLRDFYLICPGYPPQRLDRIPMSRFEGLTVLGKVKTVTRGFNQKEIPEPLQYSIISEIYR